MTLLRILLVTAVLGVSGFLWYQINRDCSGPTKCIGCGQCDKTGVCVLTGKPVGKHTKYGKK